MITLTPSLASLMAMPLPMPVDDAVMIATLPFMINNIDKVDRSEMPFFFIDFKLDVLVLNHFLNKSK